MQNILHEVAMRLLAFRFPARDEKNTKAGRFTSARSACNKLKVKEVGVRIASARCATLRADVAFK